MLGSEQRPRADGRSQSRQLSAGGMARHSPAQPSASSTLSTHAPFVQLSSGFQHSCAIRTDNKVHLLCEANAQYHCLRVHYLRRCAGATTRTSVPLFPLVSFLQSSHTDWHIEGGGHVPHPYSLIKHCQAINMKNTTGIMIKFICEIK